MRSATQSLRTRKTASAATAVVMVLSVLAFDSPAEALVKPGDTSLVSHAAGSATTAVGGRTTDASVVSPDGRTSMSADGAFVLFASDATNVVAGQSDANGQSDLFLYERSTGAITLVSHAAGSATTTGSGRSAPGSLSADGRFAVFASTAADLVAGQSDGPGLPPADAQYDVFVFDRVTGTVTLVSHAPTSATAAVGHTSGAPVISANGAFIAFSSQAPNLVAGQTGTGGVFLFERATGAVTVVSHTAAGPATVGNGQSRDPSIDGTGSFVAFESDATNLVAGQADANAGEDVFLYERATGAVALVSHPPGNLTTTSDRRSIDPQISTSGGFVTFLSKATNLVAGQVDTNHERSWGEPPPELGYDVFLLDRAAGTLTLVSHVLGNPTATGAGFSCCGPGVVSMSGDASIVTFESTAALNLPGAGGFNVKNIFLFRRATGAVTLVSHRRNDPTRGGAFDSTNPRISADGNYLAFDTISSNVGGGGDANGAFSSDVHLHQIATRITVPVSHRSVDPLTTGDRASTVSSISTDGGFVAFNSGATDLVTGQVDTNEGSDVFLFQRVGDGPEAPPADFDGDGDTDIAVYRPLEGKWYVNGGVSAAWGSSADAAVPADYNGDGTTEIAVYGQRYPGAWWYVLGGTAYPSMWPEDIPVPGDYDGDGDDDLGHYILRDLEAANMGFWLVNHQIVAHWGTAGDIPVPGDYDGDGDDDFAVFRPSNGVWFVHGGPILAWGTAGDIPVPGDYDGDGDDDVAVFRPSNGIWFVHGGPTVAWGTNGDVPVPGDYDGDGDIDIAVYRPSNGIWFVQGGPTVAWGTNGDVPVPLPDAIRRFFFTAPPP